MRTIAIESDTLANGDTLIVARVPPRMCGAPNLAAAERVRQVIAGVNPDAFDPLPEAVAVAATRDLLTRDPGESDGMCYSPNFDGPPNCDGNNSTAAVTSEESTRRLPRASFPPFDDDEGGPAEPARYPPGVACNVTGECE